MKNKIIVLMLSLMNLMAILSLFTIISKSNSDIIILDGDIIIFLLFTLIFNYVSILILNKK